MRITLWSAPFLLALSSCSSPPTPPTVDASHKRPANVSAAVDLQACQGNLQDARVAGLEATRKAKTARDTTLILASQQRILAAEASRLEARPNTVYSVLFAFADTRVVLSARESARLVSVAKDAAFVLLSGRTDGTTESPAEGRIARQRAVAVQDLLIQGGVDPARIRTTWQPVGDPVAENDSEGGRRRNRRVEVELYGVAPRTASLESDGER